MELSEIREYFSGAHGAEYLTIGDLTDRER